MQSFPPLRTFNGEDRVLLRNKLTHDPEKWAELCNVKLQKETGPINHFQLEISLYGEVLFSVKGTLLFSKEEALESSDG